MPQTCKPFKNVNCCGGTVSLLIGPLRALHSDITQSDENKKRWLETEKNRFVTRFGLWQRNLVCERVCERVCGMLCLGHLSTTTKQSAKKHIFISLYEFSMVSRARHPFHRFAIVCHPFLVKKKLEQMTYFHVGHTRESTKRTRFVRLYTFLFGCRCYCSPLTVCLLFSDH